MFNRSSTNTFPYQNLDHGKGSKFVASLSQNRGPMSKHLLEAKALTWGTSFNNPIDHGTTHLLPQIMLEIEIYTMVLRSVPKIKLLRLGDMTDTASHALEAFLRKKDDSPQLELEQRNTKLSASAPLRADLETDDWHV